jgi:hypothetical protein
MELVSTFAKAKARKIKFWDYIIYHYTCIDSIECKYVNTNWNKRQHSIHLRKLILIK